MPYLNPSMAVGAWWLWGTEEGAGRHLGISKASFIKVLEGRPIRDDTQHKIDAAWKRLSDDEKHAVRYGGEFARALSPEQAGFLKDRGFRGKRFVNAVRQFTRRRDRIPRAVGDFIEEAYS